MLDSVKQKRREVCRRNYHLAIADGYYFAARKYLRDALIWSNLVARERSKEWYYDLRGGKLHALEYRCSY